VSNVRSTERNNSDNVFSRGKVGHLDGSTVTRSLIWSSTDLVQIGIVKHESVALWGILVLATWWEKSFVPLGALENNILLFSVLE